MKVHVRTKHCDLSKAQVKSSTRCSRRLGKMKVNRPRRQNSYQHRHGRTVSTEKAEFLSAPTRQNYQYGEGRIPISTDKAELLSAPRRQNSYQHREGRIPISTEKADFPSAGRACKAIFWTSPNSTERTFHSSRSSAKGTIISASRAWCPTVQ